MSLDTIVAAATAWGRSAIAVVRLSGPDVRSILEKVAQPKGGFPPARRARLAEFVDDAGAFDEGLMTFFEARSSYTGEPSAELSCHGNPLLVERLIAACVSQGARVANPGEFTRRAFLNGRLDLTRAEAVLQAIEATSSEGLRVARAGLSGEVAGLVDSLRTQLTDAIAELEARLDYPGEDLVFEDDQELISRLRKLVSRSKAAAATYRSGRVLVEGATVALVGPVNAGKSSLFNVLGGSERALVSDTPGTTRDVIERQVQLGAVRIRLLDTAGDREAEGLEALGIEMGRRLTEEADLLLVVLPAHELHLGKGIIDKTSHRNRLIVANHADRLLESMEAAPEEALLVSAHTGEGIENLADKISEKLVGELPGGARLIIASQRQRDLLIGVAQRVEEAVEAHCGEAGLAVAAERLYAALEPLDAIVGRDSREAVLDALFSRFCIGK